MFKFKSFFLTFILFFYFSFTYSQLRIEIKGGIADPINIAVVPMKWELASTQTTYLHRIIKSDLESFGEFVVLAPESMLSLPTSKEEIYYRDWRLLGVDYLVIGGIKDSDLDGNTETNYIIFDISISLKFSLLLSSIISFKSSLIRTAASNEIFASFSLIVRSLRIPSK